MTFWKISDRDMGRCHFLKSTGDIGHPPSRAPQLSRSSGQGTGQLRGHDTGQRHRSPQRSPCWRQGCGRLRAHLTQPRTPRHYRTGYGANPPTSGAGRPYDVLGFCSIAAYFFYLYFVLLNYIHVHVCQGESGEDKKKDLNQQSERLGSEYVPRLRSTL